MSEAEPSCGSCKGCSKKKHADEPKIEKHPKSCDSCHEHVKQKSKSCESCHEHVKRKPKSRKNCDCESCHRKENEYLNEEERFIAYHEPAEYKAPEVKKEICRDIHCKDHYKKAYIKPSSIETNVPQMMMPHPMMIHPQMMVPPQMMMPPMGFHQRPPFYHPNRPMYPPPPPPPPQYSTYDRSMQLYRSPYGGGYRENFW